jgi:hypothetical protein
MTTRNKNPLIWIRCHRFFSLVILLIIFLVGFLGFEAYQSHQNKVAFQQARVAIDQVYGDIVAKVGPPADSRQINTCSRHHQEFEEGPLSCAVGTSFIYAVNDRDDATQKYKAVQNVIKDKPDLLKPDGKFSTSISDELLITTYYHSAYDNLKSKDGMECSSKYVYDTPREMDLTVSSPHALEIYIVCSDEARKQLYPLN